MAGHDNIYRVLVHLYPGGFRRHYGDDLVQNFADLLERDGAGRTWRCTTVDLLVTVPRYRLETFMNPRNSTATLYVIIGTFALLGLLSMLTGFYPAMVLLVVACAVAIAERGRLAASMRTFRTPEPRRRRKLLTASLVLALICVISTTAFWLELADDEHWNGVKLAAYNAVFFTTAAGAIVCLAAGLLTRRTPKAESLAGSV